jgi:hypothetical protein
VHSVCCLPRWGSGRWSVGRHALESWPPRAVVCVCAPDRAPWTLLWAASSRHLCKRSKSASVLPTGSPTRPPVEAWETWETRWGQHGDCDRGRGVLAGLWSRFRVPTLKPLCPLPLCVPPPTLAAPLTLPHRHKVQCHIALWIALTFGPPLFPYVQCWQGSHASLPLPLHHDYPSDEDEGSLFFQNPFFSASTSDKGPAHSPLLAPSLLPSSSHV